MRPPLSAISCGCRRQPLLRRPPTGRSASRWRDANFAREQVWGWIGAVSLSGAGAPVVAVANHHSVRLATGAAFAFPGGAGDAPLLPESILPVDFNYDFKMDFVLAGEGGVRFLRQDNPASFTDVTAQTKLPPGITQCPLHRRLGCRYRGRRGYGHCAWHTHRSRWC